MQTKLQTWGNSPGEIRMEGDAIVITPARRRFTLDSLLAEIPPDHRPAEELDGPAVGKEAW